MSGTRRNDREVITISIEAEANADPDRPGWLPDGWERVARAKNDGAISFCYPCPVCPGIMLRTKDEVIRHCLFLCEDTPLRSQAFSLIEQEQANPRHPQPARHSSKLTPLKNRQKSGSSKEGEQFGNGLFDSIPCDWVIEIRRGRSESGKMYKFYVDPTREHRFSSKEEVRFYLKEGKPLLKSNKILDCDTEGEYNIISELTFSPESLPYGWIKEMKCRHKSASKRKDALYQDPESGFVFRSIKEVERYLETGELSKKHARARKNITDLYSFESSAEIPEKLARRAFSSEPTSGQPSKGPIDDVDGGGVGGGSSDGDVKDVL